MDQTHKQYKTIKSRVRWFLEKYPRARSDDKLLLLIYWKKSDKVDLTRFDEEFLTKATSPASIIRARTLIQSEGHLLPDPETMRRRKQKYNKMRDYIREYHEVV